MPTASPDSLTLVLGPSRALAAVLLAVHAGAVAIAAAVPLPVLVRALLVALIAWSLQRSLWLHALRRSRRAVTAIALYEDDRCALRRGDGAEWQPARVLDRWVHPWATVLVVRGDTDRRRADVVIPADAVPADGFRRLRVRLRLGTAA